LLFVPVLYHDVATETGRWQMEVDKQRELIRLWNLMRKAEGPIAEEIRIQILARFAEQGHAKRAA
jgi:hypothetical protein